MPDREKVINDLQDAVNDDWMWQHADYYAKAMENALTLLKEQEAVEPTLIREGRNKYYNDYVCPRCDNVVVYEQNYCSECGVQFRWEGR
jgi:hypothetical protein